MSNNKFGELFGTTRLLTAVVLTAAASSAALADAGTELTLATQTATDGVVALTAEAEKTEQTLAGAVADKEPSAFVEADASKAASDAVVKKVTFSSTGAYTWKLGKEGAGLYLKDAELAAADGSTGPVTVEVTNKGRVDATKLQLGATFGLTLDGYLKLNDAAQATGFDTGFSVKADSTSATLETDSAAGGTTVLKTLEGVADKNVNLLNLLLTKNDFSLNEFDATKFKSATLTGAQTSGTWDKFANNVKVAKDATLTLTGFDAATLDAKTSANQNLGKVVLDGDVKLDELFATDTAKVTALKANLAPTTNTHNDALTFGANAAATTVKAFADVKAGVEALLADTGAKAVSVAPVALTVDGDAFNATDEHVLDKFKSVTFNKNASAKNFTVLNKDTKVKTKLTFTEKAAPGSLATFLETGAGKTNGTLLSADKQTPATLEVLDDQAFTKADLAAVEPTKFDLTVSIPNEATSGSPVANKKQLWLIAEAGLADVADNLKVAADTKKAVVFNGSAGADVATPLADGTKFDDWLITSSSNNPAQVETNAKPGHGVIFNPSQDPNPTHAADKPSTLTVALDGKTALTDFLPESFAKLGTVENFKTKFVAKTDGKELSYTKEDADKFTAAVDKFAVVNKAATTDAPVETTLVFKDASASAVDVPDTSAFLGKVEAGTTKVLESVGSGAADAPKTYVLSQQPANSTNFSEFRLSAETYAAAGTDGALPTPVDATNLLAKNVVTSTGKLWLGGFTGLDAQSKTLEVQKDGTLALNGEVSLDEAVAGLTLDEGAKVNLEGGKLKTNKESLADAVTAAKAVLTVSEGKVDLESTKHLDLGLEAQKFKSLLLKEVTHADSDKLTQTTLAFNDPAKLPAVTAEAGRGQVVAVYGADKGGEFALGNASFTATSETAKPTAVAVVAAANNTVVFGADTAFSGTAGFDLQGEGNFKLTGTNTATNTKLSNVGNGTVAVAADAVFSNTELQLLKGTLDLTGSAAASKVKTLELFGGVTKFKVTDEKTHSALTAETVKVLTSPAKENATVASFDLDFTDPALNTGADKALAPSFLVGALEVYSNLSTKVADDKVNEELAKVKVTDNNVLFDYTAEKSADGLTFKAGQLKSVAASVDEKAETHDEALALDELRNLALKSTDTKDKTKALAQKLTTVLTPEERDLLLQEVKPLLQGSLGGVVAENTASLAGHLPQVDVLAFGSQLAPLAFQSYVQNYLAARNGKLSVRDLKGLEFADNGGLASAAKGAKAQQGTGVNAWVSAVFDSSSQGVKKEESASAQAQPAQGAQAQPAQPAQQAATTAAKYGYDASSQSVFVGADKLVLPGDEYVVAEGYRVGLVAGYTRNAVKTSTDSAVKNEARVNLFQVGAYANLAVAPGLVVDALAGYGYANVNGKRVLSTLKAVSDSNYGAQVVFGSVGVNYSLPVGPGLLTPYAKVSYTGTFSPEYTETEGDLNTLFQSSFSGVTPVQGANDSLLKVAAETNQALVLEAGSKYEVAVSPELRAYATLGVAYDVLAAAAANTSATFAAKGATAKLEGTTYSLDPFRVKAGVGATYQVLENVDLSFGYNFTGLNNFQSHEGNLKLNVKF